MKSWQKPTQDEIKLVVENIQNNSNLGYYFFSKLENPEWFIEFKCLKLLDYKIITYENGNEKIEWMAFPYLIKIAKEKTIEVMETFKPFIDETLKQKNISQRLNHFIIPIALAMPNDQFIQISEIILNMIKNVEYKLLINYNNISNLLKKMLDISKQDIALQIIKSFLKIFIRKQELRYPIFSGNNEETSYEQLEEYSILENYIYSKIIEVIKNSFNDNRIIFEILCDIYDNIFIGLTEEEIKRYEELGIYTQRSAIEFNSQDYYKQNEAIYILISTIRDYAEKILESGNKNDINYVFDLLENKNRIILIRIILHLLRIFKDYDEQVLIKYITNKNLFYKASVHHEYYLLLQNKFISLQKKQQDDILGYIENGPIGDFYDSAEKINYWQWKKIKPIKEYLPESYIKKYKNFLNMPNDEHPEFLYYISGGVLHEKTPIENSTLSAMKIDEIIEYIQNFNPNEKDLDSPQKEGLANSIENDIKINSRKYLDGILKFKNISDPIYINGLLLAICEIEKNEEDWKKIIDFGLWFVEKCKKDKDKDIYRYSYSPCLTLMRLFRELINKKSNIIFEKNIITNIFTVIKIMLEFKWDKNLITENTFHRNYYFNAINNLRGSALETLIIFALWRKQKNENIDYIILIFDELLNESEYVEVWTIFGRFIVLLYFYFQDWSLKNIDKILQENDKIKFTVAWSTYVKYSNIYTDIWEFLKIKYEYIFNNKLYLEDAFKEEREYLGNHISIYYVYGKINLDTKIMKILFEDNDFSIERQSFIKFAGIELCRTIEKSKDIIYKLQEFWDWYIEKIKGNENEHIKELAEFEHWYGSSALNRDFAINTLHKLITIHRIKMNLYVFDKVLLEDLTNYTRKIFEIIKQIVFTYEFRMLHYFENDIIKECIKYIKNNNFPDDIKLKKDKDDFINKLCENDIYNNFEKIEELKPYLE